MYTPDTKYDSRLRKIANERLRKLEKMTSNNGIPLKEYSYKYAELEEYANKHSFTPEDSPFVDAFDGQVRFVGKRMFDQFTDAQKIEYNKMLWKFLEADTSTLGGLKAAAQRNYENLDNIYDLANRGISQDYAMEIIRIYNTKIKPNNQTHYGSTIILVSYDQIDWNNVKDMENRMGMSTALKELDKTLMLMNDDRWSEINPDMLKGKRHFN